MEDGRGNHYQYDAEGQLTDAWYNAVDPAGSYGSCQRQDHFGYDALGNRRSWNYVQTHGWQEFSRKDNGLNQYRMWSPFSMTNYDDDIGMPWGTPQQANGVLMQDGNITAGYNALNQMVMVTNGTLAPNWMFFGYDPLGRRVQQWVGQLNPNPGDPPDYVPPIGNSPATFFYYDGWNLIQEGSSSTDAQRQYVHGARVDEIVAQITPPDNAIRYSHYDASGHCTLLTDNGGGIAEQYEYDAFGYPYFFNANGTNVGYSAWGNRFQFTGREWLKELKLYDYRNRMYQPELGRFMQPDPKHFAAGDYNLYRYCHNDPVNTSDPTGLRKLTMEGGGDWITGSDGLSAWDREVGGMPSNRWQAGPNGGGGGKSTFGTAREAADSRVAEVTRLAKEQAPLHEKAREPYSTVGQAEDGTSNYIVSPIKYGKALGDISKLNRAKLGKKALTSEPGQQDLPKGYKFCGYVLGQVAFHGDYVTADINEAKKANLQVAIIVAPGNKQHPRDYYIPYEKGKPDPVY